MVPVARRNLLSEKSRFAISVAGVGFAVLLILTVLALYRGWSHSGETFEKLPGQLWVVQEGTTDPFHSVSLIETSQLDGVATVPGVVAVIPVLSRQMNFGPDLDQDVRLLALDFPAEVPLDDDTREHFLPAEGEMVIESTLSRMAGLHGGDTAMFGDIELRVAHVRSRTSEVLTPFAFVNFADAERIFGVGDIVNYGMVAVSDDADLANVAASIEALDPDFQVYTAGEFATSIRKEIDETFIPVIIILVAIGFIVGAAVVGLTIYTATIERSREFGVMKAVGASPSFLYRIVLSQSALLTSGGFVVGYLGARGVAELAQRLVPEFATDFEPKDLALVLAAAMAMAVLASFVPVRRINAIDPAIVFRA